MDGTIDRPLGGGNAGRGHHWFQRSNLVRPSRQLPQRSPPRDRAIHTQEPGRPRLRGDDRGSESVHTPLEDSNASLPQTGSERAVDGVQVRRVRRGVDVRTLAQENGRRETVRRRAHAVAVACPLRSSIRIPEDPEHVIDNTSFVNTNLFTNSLVHIGIDFFFSNPSKIVKHALKYGVGFYKTPSPKTSRSEL